MGHRRVEDITNALTPEERLQFGELIDECTTREARIRENAEKARATVAELEAQHRKLWLEIERLEARARQMRDAVGRLCLVLQPSGVTVH